MVFYGERVVNELLVRDERLCGSLLHGQETKRFSNTFTQLGEAIGWNVVNSDSAEKQKKLGGSRSRFIIALLLAL